MRVLAGDIGGTNLRLAIVDIDIETVQVLHERRFASKEFSGLAAAVQAFLADVADEPGRACFGIACPVVNGTCTATNLGWTIDVASLAAEIGIPRTRVINDLEAMGHGVPRLGAADLVTLQAGEPHERGAIALIGAGTGLGEAFLTWTDDGYLVHASEGGHVGFAATTSLERGLLRALGCEFGRVSIERVLSGPGLVNIYRYLLARGCAPEQERVHAEMQHDDPAAVIGRHALAGTDPLSTRALDLFVSVYGAHTGDVALTLMATGGLYVAGGIAPRILPKLRDGTFITAFRDKGRLSDVVARVPVHVIVNPRVGLIGAAVVAAHL